MRVGAIPEIFPQLENEKTDFWYLFLFTPSVHAWQSAEEIALTGMAHFKLSVKE